MAYIIYLDHANNQTDSTKKRAEEYSKVYPAPF